MEHDPIFAGVKPLYKYRSLDTEKDVEFAADILLNHRLYGATPRSFNDPFDCDACYSLEASPDEKLARAIARIKSESPGITDELARALAPARCAAAEANGVTKNRSWVKNELGVVSLAGVLDNLLLWAHYAGGHSGIAIEFRMSQRMHAAFFGDTLPVEYATDRPVVNCYRDSSEAYAQKMVLTKSRDWEYEREWRIIVKDRQKSSYVEFDPNIISAVYMGCQITQDNRALVRQWLRSRDTTSMPRLFQAIQSSSLYGLEFEPVDVGDAGRVVKAALPPATA